MPHADFGGKQNPLHIPQKFLVPYSPHLVWRLWQLWECVAVVGLKEIPLSIGIYTYETGFFNLWLLKMYRFLCVGRSRIADFRNATAPPSPVTWHYMHFYICCIFSQISFSFVSSRNTVTSHPAPPLQTCSSIFSNCHLDFSFLGFDPSYICITRQDDFALHVRIRSFKKCVYHFAEKCERNYHWQQRSNASQLPTFEVRQKSRRVGSPSWHILFLTKS